MRMKTLAPLLAVSLLLTAATSTLASNQPPSAKPAVTVEKVKVKKSAKKAQNESGRLLTGSYIKQKYHSHGFINDAASPVIVIDSKAISHSGASDLRQLLARSGSNH